MFIARKSGYVGIYFGMVSVKIHTQRCDNAAFADIKVLATATYEYIDKVAVYATHTLIGFDGLPVI